MGLLPPGPPVMLLLPPTLLLLLGPEPSPSAAFKQSHVYRRGILELAGTVNCVGTRSPIAYMSYGCYCGLGGHGQPLDAIDQCCQQHDCCYSRTEDAGCMPKLQRYSWQCVNQSVVCGPAQSKCQELLCKCDQEIASCLARTTYNFKYLFYPKHLCEQDSPKCD
ncbi:group 10 secretory phospholipase A2-like [Carlito syrichta]|uniref:Phospholipase A2 n=1 Tax=Carlito syrichta TaxID=1868482 RepID=A0A1U7TSV3_CARSF|nr:group 10 secretory phospholipase A2-like [Carlito syrichta]